MSKPKRIYVLQKYRPLAGAFACGDRPAIVEGGPDGMLLAYTSLKRFRKAHPGEEPLVMERAK
jgi:hypothetical protein